MFFFFSNLIFLALALFPSKTNRNNHFTAMETLRGGGLHFLSAPKLQFTAMMGT